METSSRQIEGDNILKPILKMEEKATSQGFQKVMLTIIAGLILTGVLKLFNMSEQIVRLDERDQMKIEKINALQVVQNKIQLDIIEVKDRLYRLETQESFKK